MGERFAYGTRVGIKAWKDPELVSSALKESLTHGPQYTLWERVSSKAFVSRAARKYEKDVPNWLNLSGLKRVVNELSSRQFYTRLITATPPDIQKHITQDLGIKDMADAIARENTRFITSTLYLAVLAAAQGGGVAYKPGYAQEIAERYPLQPTAAEFMARLTELVPNPDKPRTTNDPTLIDYLKKHNAFTEKRSGRTCPAIPFTGLILKQWGRQLDEDLDYRNAFKKMILLSPFS